MYRYNSRSVSTQFFLIYIELLTFSLLMVPLGTVLSIFEPYQWFLCDHWFKYPCREIRWVGTCDWGL